MDKIDIEIVKEFIKEVQEEYSETLVDGKVYRIENIPLEFKSTKELANAISNVLSELEETKETLKCTQDSWYKDSQELETYKKIAEKLAEEMVLHGICSGVEESDKCYANEIQCGKCIIDWARKEVEGNEEK